MSRVKRVNMYRDVMQQGAFKHFKSSKLVYFERIKIKTR